MTLHTHTHDIMLEDQNTHPKNKTKKPLLHVLEHVQHTTKAPIYSHFEKDLFCLSLYRSISPYHSLSLIGVLVGCVEPHRKTIGMARGHNQASLSSCSFTNILLPSSDVYVCACVVYMPLRHERCGCLLPRSNGSALHTNRSLEQWHGKRKSGGNGLFSRFKDPARGSSVSSFFGSLCLGARAGE